MVARTMANEPTPEFQKLWSNLTEPLRLQYENTIQHPDANSVIEHVCGVLTAIACLAGCVIQGHCYSSRVINP